MLQPIASIERNMSQRSAKNEATRFNPYDSIYTMSNIPIRQQINDHVKSLWISQKRSNI